MSTSDNHQRALDARRDRREQHRLLEAYAPADDHPADPTTTEIGEYFEQRAVDHLLAHGYDIVERNYRCDIGELDIVAADGDVMVFVEVRSRANTEHGDAIESVNRRKQLKVTRVAAVYLAHRRPAYDEFRFDVVAIHGDGTADADITIYDDAWRGGLL